MRIVLKEPDIDGAEAPPASRQGSAGEGHQQQPVSQLPPCAQLSISARLAPWTLPAEQGTGLELSSRPVVCFRGT